MGSPPRRSASSATTAAAPQRVLTLRGRLDELDRLAFLGNRVDIAGWDVAWFVVTPELTVHRGRGRFRPRERAPTLCEWPR